MNGGLGGWRPRIKKLKFKIKIKNILKKHLYHNSVNNKIFSGCTDSDFTNVVNSYGFSQGLNHNTNIGKVNIICLNVFSRFSKIFKGCI